MSIHEREYNGVLFRYDSETGQIWRQMNGFTGPFKGRKEAGDWKETALSMIHPERTTVHFVVNIGERNIGAHRLAWYIVTGEFPKELDHKNRNGLDNRWLNLREVSASVNVHNQGIRSNNKSGVRGVCYNSKGDNWEAGIMVQGHFYRKKFKSKDDAIAYRKSLEEKFAHVTQIPQEVLQ